MGGCGIVHGSGIVHRHGILGVWYMECVHIRGGGRGGLLAEGLTEGSGGAPHWNPMATAPWVTVLLSETSLNPNSFSVTCCPFGRRNWPRTLLSYITAPDDRAMEYNPLGQKRSHTSEQPLLGVLTRLR